MNSDESELWAAYKATDFQADVPQGTISIRVDSLAPEVDLLLREHDVQDWVFITAHNPDSQPLDVAENSLRHQNLVKEVQQRDLPCFPGRGVGDDPAWTPEESLLVLGLAQTEAIELARDYGQNAVVCGRIGQTAELVDCRPDKSP